MTSFIKNKELLAPLNNEAHAFAKFKFSSKKYPASLIEEIAIGQSLGAWEEEHVEKSILQQKIAKIVNFETVEDDYIATIAFPYSIWRGKLSWLLIILFGKMSFYEGVQLNSVYFSANCFDNDILQGPKFPISKLREMLKVTETVPLLMGILKPNVAMSANKICDLYVRAAENGVHILKDDEIRHDENIQETLERVEKISNVSSKRNINSLYAVHLQIRSACFLEDAKALINAGAQAFLINTWTAGLDALQELRRITNIPILSHPALVGAFGLNSLSANIHPRVTLAQLIRAAGADLSLFPSPYGKLGLEKNLAIDIAKNCLEQNENLKINACIPVPSAGIKPEHAILAIKDFGNDFILNAGTGIFSHPEGIEKSILEFKNGLYNK